MKKPSSSLFIVGVTVAGVLLSIWLQLVVKHWQSANWQGVAEWIALLVAILVIIGFASGFIGPRKSDGKRYRADEMPGDDKE